MASLETLGVGSLSLRGANNDYNRLSRFFVTKAEADASLANGSWIPTEGVVNACITGDAGLMIYDFSLAQLNPADGTIRPYIDTKISELVAGAPAALDTLGELATALGDSPTLISDLQTSVTTEISDRTTAVSALDTRLIAAEGAISTLNTNETATQSDVATLQTDVTAAQSDVSTLQTDVTALQSDVTSLQNESGVYVQAHASFDASAGAAFNYATDTIASYGVSNIVRNSQGNFTVTFSSAFASSAYTVVAQAGDQDYSGINASPRSVCVVNRNANSVDIIVERTDDAVNDDNGYVALMVMGTLA